MAANLAALMPEPSKAASISCRLASGVSTRPRLSCLRISPADNNDAVDVIASRLRHLHYLRQVVLRATLTLEPQLFTEKHRLYQKLNAFGLTVAAVYDRRWLTTPALIETPLQVKTAR